MLKIDEGLAKIGVDTAENEPYFLKIPKPSKLFIIQVNPLFRSPPYPQGSSSRDVQASHIRDAQREERHLLHLGEGLPKGQGQQN